MIKEANINFNSLPDEDSTTRSVNLPVQELYSVLQVG